MLSIRCESSININRKEQIYNQENMIGIKIGKNYVTVAQL